MNEPAHLRYRMAFIRMGFIGMAFIGIVMGFSADIGLVEEHCRWPIRR